MENIVEQHIQPINYRPYDTRWNYYTGQSRGFHCAPRPLIMPFNLIVSKPRYADGKVWINPTQHFTDVPEKVWEYEVGAYQACEKWLKDRKDEELGRAELQQYRAILVAIAETLSVMGEIDAALW